MFSPFNNQNLVSWFFTIKCRVCGLTCLVFVMYSICLSYVCYIQGLSCLLFVCLISVRVPLFLLFETFQISKKDALESSYFFRQPVGNLHKYSISAHTPTYNFHSGNFYHLYIVGTIYTCTIEQRPLEKPVWNLTCFCRITADPRNVNYLSFLKRIMSFQKTIIIQDISKSPRAHTT